MYEFWDTLQEATGRHPIDITLEELEPFTCFDDNFWGGIIARLIVDDFEGLRKVIAELPDKQRAVIPPPEQFHDFIQFLKLLHRSPQET